MKKILYVILSLLFLGVLFFASDFLEDEQSNKIASENSTINTEVNNIIASTPVEKNEEQKPTTKPEEKPISNPVTEVNSSNFEQEVLKSNKVVLVDFYATWCGPCRYLSPILKEIANETPNLKVVKINVDKEEKLSYKYRAFSLPTVILFKNGKEVNRFVGAAPKKEIIKFINQYL